MSWRLEILRIRTPLACPRTNSMGMDLVGAVIHHVRCRACPVHGLESVGAYEQRYHRGFHPQGRRWCRCGSGIRSDGTRSASSRSETFPCTSLLHERTPQLSRAPYELDLALRRSLRRFAAGD